MSTQPVCACQRIGGQRHEEALEAFGALRNQCPVLRLLVPDDLWPAFSDWHRHDDEVAWHRSICLLALERGHLASFTTPLHRFLIAEGALRPDVRAQYVQDLRERWMHAEDPRERHQKSRMFTGRFVELHLAAWLEGEGWRIDGLEALRPGPDIEASREMPHAFEVKAIGTQDEAFDSIVDSLHNRPALRWTSPDAAVNYLVFRAFEAAWQLRSQAKRRVAILAIEGLSWHSFEIQLKEGWVDWSHPGFSGEDPDWKRFIATQQERFPSLHRDLEQVIASLDEIWIVERLDGFKYHRAFLIEPKAAATPQ